jgi:DNA polymerase-3 subunit delta
MDALAFLKARGAPLHPVYALIGDEDFLKRQVRERIVRQAVGDEDPAFAVSVYAGDKLEFSTARNELDTLPFLSQCRVVIVEGADTFVSEHRPALEAYLTKPSTVGLLILDVKTFIETTRLARALPTGAKVVCKTLPAYKLYELRPWCIEWARTTYNKKLSSEAADQLLDLVGSSMGLLDQELGKLATAVGAKPEIGAEDVDRFVGRSKAADVFRIMDAIGMGRASEAISIVEELFTEGEDPMAILGPLTAQLRKLVMVARLTPDRMSLPQAMDAAGVSKFLPHRESTERQLRYLGRARLQKLTEWLVEINLGLKGGCVLPERVQVERLIVMLARPREEVKK